VGGWVSGPWVYAFSNKRNIIRSLWIVYLCPFHLSTTSNKLRTFCFRS
jgi:hypothetical protein